VPRIRTSSTIICTEVDQIYEEQVRNNTVAFVMRVMSSSSQTGDYYTTTSDLFTQFTKGKHLRGICHDKLLEKENGRLNYINEDDVMELVLHKNKRK